MLSQGSEIWWRFLQVLWEAGINVNTTSSFLPPFNFFDISWKRPFSVPLGRLRCEGAVRQCSREVSALLKCFLYMVVAEIWAEIRYSCGSWCSAAWLIFYSTFFPLLAFLWFLFRVDTKQAPCCCLQVGCSAKLESAGLAYKQ